MTRRARLGGIFQIYYTSTSTIPTPFATSNFINRLINIPKLIDIKFTYLPAETTLKTQCQLFKLPPKDSIALVGTVRPMEKRDVSSILKLWNTNQAKYKLRYKFTQDDVLYYIFP